MEQLKAFWEEEDGVGIIEIILILVILIMIIVIFREHIVKIITNAFKEINGGADSVNKKISIK